MSKRDWGKIIECGFEDIVEKTGDWRRSKGFDTGWGNFSEKLMLILTEVAEVVEAEEIILRSQKAVSGFHIGRIGNACDDLKVFSNNYIEEWIDVMVRIFDLVDACGIDIDRVPMLGIQGTAEVFTMFPLEKQMNKYLRDILLSISGAMEAFRDIELTEDESGVSVLPESGVALSKISLCLSRAARVAMGAITATGACWEIWYAVKMTKNEGRKKKHGRVR